MTVHTDFYSVQYSDGLLTVTLSPPVAIGNWTIRFRQFKHFGGGQPLILASGQSSGLLEVNISEKWCGSGTGDGVSGIAILDSGIGTVRISLPPSEMSGRDFGAYAYKVDRVDSGYNKTLVEGYRLHVP